MEKFSTIDRIKLVVKSSIQMLLFVNIILLFFEIDILLGFVDEPINWDYYIYINLYAFIVSIVFGFLDKPKLEDKILFFLLIISFLIYIIPNQFSDHFGYVFFGVIMGRKLLVIVDYSLKKLSIKSKKGLKNS